MTLETLDRVLLPPRLRVFSRDGWHVYFDPHNFLWTRVNDSGHYILDCAFPDGREDALETEAAFHAIPAGVETGLVLGMAETVVVGSEQGPRVLRRGE